ncbi:MAG: proline--tRNA ligase [Verrucomicrobiota bacterium]
MRWTQALIPTLKETPAEAEILSHKLLLRAGLVRKLAGGLYTFLPLGLRALRKIERIVREEMDRAGALEVLMPALQPPEIWQQSGRYETAQEVFFKVHDRAKKEWILGPTHEEVITTMVAGEINSYRQLPKNFYQIQTKFRDEIRPRFGLMRAKEFIMKDAYSFDTTDELAQVSYQKMYDAYTQIFQRCGLKTFPVEADTGLMGGKFSHEFMVPAETGENEVVYCDGCGYAANIEKAQSQTTSNTEHRTPNIEVEKFATPNLKSIESLVKAMNIPAEQQIKTLVYIVEDKPVLILVRGDHQLNEAKLLGMVGTANFRAATADEVFAALKAYPGSLGGVGVTEFSIYADETLRGANGMTTGANENGFHNRNVSMERDIRVKQWADLRSVKTGEPCTKCGQPLKIRRAIEVGHVFKLGTKYTEALKALFVDESGKQQPSFMGCYGIGVTRTMQAIIEQSNDKDGIIWPLSVAPYQVCITPLGVVKDSPVMRLAEKIYAELSAQKIDVILDDRDDRPGVKFKDADLVGFPIRVTIGEKSLANGEVELKLRGGEIAFVKTDDLLAKVFGLLSGV